jgi:tRNA uridine 5-carbamoylmethylation protein Kti12
MTRWDSPLFIVVEDDDTPPCDSMWEALVGSDGKTKVVKANLATVLVCISAALTRALLADTPRNLQQSRTTSMNSTRPPLTYSPRS